MGTHGPLLVRLRRAEVALENMARFEPDEGMGDLPGAAHRNPSGARFRVIVADTKWHATEERRGRLASSEEHLGAPVREGLDEDRFGER
jgi:hypothetical protein